MSPQAELEDQIDTWRGYVQRRQAISLADVDELEDHLRGQVADLQATGLDDGEAFLIAITRLGNLDVVSREFAREHSDRLWKQLSLVRRLTRDVRRPPRAAELVPSSWRSPSVRAPHSRPEAPGSTGRRRSPVTRGCS